jgi:glycine cleavage system H protein
MSTPANLKYTKSHEWVRTETDGTVTVGITHHAQESLGDLVFVQAPAIGRKLKQGEACAVVESVKAASDLFAPVSGEVVAINAELADTPEKINQDAYAAWIFKLKPVAVADVAGLLDAAAYQAIADADKG